MNDSASADEHITTKLNSIISQFPYFIIDFDEEVKALILVSSFYGLKEIVVASISNSSRMDKLSHGRI